MIHIIQAMIHIIQAMIHIIFQCCTYSVVPNQNVVMTPMVSPGLSTAVPMRMSPAMVASPVKSVSPVVPCTPGTPGIVTPVSPAAYGVVAPPQQPIGKDCTVVLTAMLILGSL